MVSTLDRCIGLESSRVIDPLLPVGYRLGRYGVVNFDKKKKWTKNIFSRFSQNWLMLLIHLVTFNPFHKRKQIKGRGVSSFLNDKWQKHLWLTAPKIFFQRIHGLFHIHSTFDMTFWRNQQKFLFSNAFFYENIYQPTLAKTFFFRFRLPNKLERQKNFWQCLHFWMSWSQEAKNMVSGSIT